MGGATTLHIGDGTFASSFTKVSRGENGDQFNASFKAPKGREFVVLLIGDVEKGTISVDVEKMLNDLGFYYREDEEWT